MNSTAEGRGKETILVVDDADAIRKMVCSMLKHAGYRCLEAADGIEGLRVFERMPGLDLLLTDVMMPNMGGPELARRISRTRPDLRVMFMSGFSDDPVVRGIEHSPSLFLPKPFTAVLLVQKVRQALETPWNGLPDAMLGAGAQ